MSARTAAIAAGAAAALLGLLGLSCRDIAGIHPIVYGDAGSSTCPAPTTVLSGKAVYDSLLARDGFVFLGIFGSGLQRCATSGCTTPTQLVTDPAFQTMVLGGPNEIDYASSDSSGTGGSVRSVAEDGTNDQAIASSLAYPALVARAGANLFWVDDPAFWTGTTQDSVNCIGCQGTASAPWITQLFDSVYALAANAQNVFAVVDDDQGSIDLVACSTQAPCGPTPAVLLTQLDYFSYPQQLAVDGTYAYVARNSHEDVVRVDAAGNTTVIVPAQDVTALAIDAAAGNLYFGTSTGVVERVKTDGSGPITTLGCDTNDILAIAVDDAVYFLGGATGSDVFRVAK